MDKLVTIQVRIWQTTACLIFTFPQTDAKYRSVSLGVTCDQQIESPIISRPTLVLIISRYQNSQRSHMIAENFSITGNEQAPNPK